MAIIFPPEPAFELIRDRAATPEDFEAGRAAFSCDTRDPALANLPVPVFLPCAATVQSEDEAPCTVTVFQVEVAREPAGMVVLGFMLADGGIGACASDEAQPWPCFYYFHRDAALSIDSLQQQAPGGFARQGQTLATVANCDDQPTLFARHHRGMHVRTKALDVGQGSEYQGGLAKCDACFVVCFQDLEMALDEINTLINVQAMLEALIPGFLFMDWNKNLSEMGGSQA